MGQETYQLRYLQGAGGGGSSGGGGGGGGWYPSGGGGGDDYSGGSGGSSGGLVALYIIGGIVIFVAVVACLVRGCSGASTDRSEPNCSKSYKDTMKSYINEGPQDAVNLASGVYHGRYKQYRRWYDVPKFTLNIDVASNMCSGHGSDAVGSYKLEGVCRGKRLAVEKTYIIGTGNSLENFGHTVLLLLEFQKLEGYSTQARPSWGFVGSWKVSTASYQGTNSMEIWQEDPNYHPTAETLAPEDRVQVVAIEIKES
mmetsp:Transcript_4004/g.8801  ORF Transcript_4004/g.8801 Transcript_4004/m.8801 type:complete len:255 (-) Transcript_4004:1795-2559(-)